MIALSVALPALRRAWLGANHDDRAAITAVAAALVEISEPVEVAA